ncbi:tyrosine protein kinase [Aquincola sp. J276]|uniref:tyrosine protein kinase n=1 Tax=Aquincola sp. J276 TaxID=2898432 RepID=UPI0021519438|nr:tyrosine protein kinase [Aquincola sp. J276]MCR5868794.1 tyrosine protein kinase [Aquincola sp. J276]
MKSPDVNDWTQALPGLGERARQRVVDRSIGDFIRELRSLDEEQVQGILAYQRQHKVRFGEAAVALKYATQNDVLWALSQQFHYPYAPEEGRAGLDAELVAAIDPFSDQAEVLRDVRSQLVMGVLSSDAPRRALAIVSPDIGDGKTFFVANLGVTFSQLEGRTLIVDADMRTPRLHQLFGVEGPGGLSGILAGRTDAGVIRQVPALPNLYVLPVGTVPPNPLELVQRPAFALLMRELCGKFDHVLVDTPAACHGADARVIAAHCGAALTLGRRGRSRLAAIRTLLAQMAKAQVQSAGVMINEQ